MSRKAIILWTSLAAVILAADVWYLMGRHNEESEPSPVTVFRKSGTISEAQRAERMKRREAIRARMEGLQAGMSLSTNGAPTLAVLDEIERQSESELDELQRQVLKELDVALLRDDKKAALNAINRFLKMLASAKNISPAMRVTLRRHIVNAAGWVGGAAVPELITFLADEDPTVRELAMNQFEQALWDFSLGDREVSQIVVAAAQVLTDTDDLNAILFNIDLKMRRSVGVETILAISQTGTDEAKSLLPDEVLMFTGDDTITTEEDLLRWQEEHPDGTDDEEFYGPQKEL